MVKCFSKLALICFFFHACRSTSKLPETHDTVWKAIPVSPKVATRSVDSTAIIAAKKNRELQMKYGKILGVPADSINLRLYSFINEWLGTPYLWGGTDKNGIDCSAFTQQLFQDVYDVQIPRTSLEQTQKKHVELFRSKTYLAEGDIVFFRTMAGTVVSHVGFYMRNNKFISASRTKGVSISSLLEPYWKKCFVAAGRVKPPAVGSRFNNITRR